MLIAVRRHILFLPSPQIKGTGTSLVLKNMRKKQTENIRRRVQESDFIIMTN